MNNASGRMVIMLDAIQAVRTLLFWKGGSVMVPAQLPRT